MPYKKIEQPPEACPVDYAFQRVGGKYKARIIWHISQYEALRYGGLKRAITGVTSKMLTQTLRELENDGLVMRHVFPGALPKVEYSLTDEGKTLMPFIEHLRAWGRMQQPSMRVAG